MVAPRKLGLGLATATLAMSCVARSGGGWTPQPAADAPRVSALVFGNLRDDANSHAVLEHLRQGEASTPTFALWLGSPAAKARDCRRVQGLPESGRQLVKALAGVPIYAVGSPAQWRCGHDLPAGLEQPAANYVVDIAATGETQVVSTCSPTACTVPPPPPSVLARLVLVDESPWAFPDLDKSPESAAAQAQLVHLLEALPPALETPHLLVTHLPIESSGSHGQGGWSVTSTFIHHPQIVQAALAGGRFDGVIAGHEGNLQLVDDLGDAVKRSSRVWLRRPVFQMVAGSSGDADVRHPAHPRMRPRWQGIALRPDHSAPHGGFGQLEFKAESITATLHAKFGARWRRVSASYALLRPAHPTEAPAPSFTPCRDCDPRTGAVDHEPGVDYEAPQ